MKIVGVIPARYKSSRFPGKPLCDIHGKPMVWWVYNQALKVKEFSDVYVATESELVKETCEKLNIKVLLTSDKHLTGTDRVCEVSKIIAADLYVNIQGDEPMIEPEVIIKAINPFFSNQTLRVTNLMTKINNPIDVVNFTVPKVLVNNANMGVYLSRSPSPYPKGSLDFNYQKQVCVYGFKPEALRFFMETPRGRLEEIEDIEILRFIENGYPVQFIEVLSNSIAVDTPYDLKKVLFALKNF